MRGLEHHPQSLKLRHLAVLTLIRAHAVVHARELFQKWSLADSDNEDVATLEARILKEEAMELSGRTRQSHLIQAATLYETVYRRTGGYYPGVNAATLWLLSGRREHAEAIAAEITEICGRIDPLSENPYYLAATQAEAALVLGQADLAAVRVAEAARLHGNDYPALASTRKQLEMVCGARGVDAEFLDLLRPPEVLHYTGHIIAGPGQLGRFPAEAEPMVVAEIARSLKGVGFGYGSLASGADILFAEALLRQGSELHVVLPFEKESFKQISVAGSGADWLDRFDRCLERAAEVRFATEDPFVGDDPIFGYTARLAMGFAVLRAQFLHAEVRQVAVWDGVAQNKQAGTGADIDFWRSSGRRSDVIRVHGTLDAAAAPAPMVASPSTMGVVRQERAMLFGDVRGFSKLTDLEIPIFVERVLGSFASVLARYDGAIRFRNTWGDGLFVVFDNPNLAAHCALDLQRSIDQLDRSECGLPETIALRLGGHYGPVYATKDPVLGRTNFFGAHVSRTARIEPVTPPGCVFVTEAFAARLTLDGAPFTCDYAGQVPAAKGFGLLRMYLLRAQRSWPETPE